MRDRNGWLQTAQRMGPADQLAREVRILRGHPAFGGDAVAVVLAAIKAGPADGAAMCHQGSRQPVQLGTVADSGQLRQAIVQRPAELGMLGHLQANLDSQCAVALVVVAALPGGVLDAAGVGDPMRRLV